MGERWRPGLSTRKAKTGGRGKKSVYERYVKLFCFRDLQTECQAAPANQNRDQTFSRTFQTNVHWLLTVSSVTRVLDPVGGAELFLHRLLAGLAAVRGLDVFVHPHQRLL